MEFICEAFDHLQRAFDLNGFNDHQLHCVLRFDSGARRSRNSEKSGDRLHRGDSHPRDTLCRCAKPRWVSLDPESCARAFVVALTETDFETSPRRARR